MTSREAGLLPKGALHREGVSLGLAGLKLEETLADITKAAVEARGYSWEQWPSNSALFGGLMTSADGLNAAVVISELEQLLNAGAGTVIDLINSRLDSAEKHIREQRAAK